MCGIYCEFCSKSSETLLIESDQKSKNLLISRGPNQQNLITLQNVAFYATLLWQQGSVPTAQPVVSEKFVLLFNGDCFMDKGEFGKTTSDTEWLFESLNQTCGTETKILDLFRKLRGPLSLILFDRLKKKLYFLRDSLGRNSLLIGRHQEKFILTSVLGKPVEGSIAAMELPALGIYIYDFTSFRLYPWQSINSHEVFQEQFNELEHFLKLPIKINETKAPLWLLKPIHSLPSYNFFEIASQKTFQNPEDWFECFLENEEISKTVDQVMTLLTNSVKDRLENTPQLCKTCMGSPTIAQCQHARLGILFSGGLDCSILARIADQLLDKDIPIDLMNVAFEKVAIVAQTSVNWDVPDRVTARASLTELTRRCPDRRWNLVEINVRRDELNEQLAAHISHLVYPLDSVLDESLGAALWFAGRGKTDSYETVNRVALIGSGADELFGGYTRHRNAFTRNNKTGKPPFDTSFLEEELALDWVRLPTRNLARDDRIIADSQCTPRAPYVEEEFARFIRSLRPEQKCCHALEAGVGDKLLLRLCAHRLGLSGVAAFKKRALQFGSRIADSRQNAKDKSYALA